MTSSEDEIDAKEGVTYSFRAKDYGNLLSSEAEFGSKEDGMCFLRAKGSGNLTSSEAESSVKHVRMYYLQAKDSENLLSTEAEIVIKEFATYFLQAKDSGNLPSSEAEISLKEDGMYLFQAKDSRNLPVPIKGRFQKAHVLVDFGHFPHGLEKLFGRFEPDRKRHTGNTAYHNYYRRVCSSFKVRNVSVVCEPNVNGQNESKSRRAKKMLTTTVTRPRKRPLSCNENCTYKPSRLVKRHRVSCCGNNPLRNISSHDQDNYYKRRYNKRYIRQFFKNGRTAAIIKTDQKVETGVQSRFKAVSCLQPHPPTRTHTRRCAHIVHVREIDVSELFRFRLFVAKQGTKAKIRVMKFKDKLAVARGHTLCAKPAKFSYLSSSVSQSASITWSVSISQSVSVSQTVILLVSRSVTQSLCLSV